MTATDSAPLPQIICNNRPLQDVTADAMDALIKANPPRIFQRGGVLVRIATTFDFTDDGPVERPFIQQLDPPKLQVELAEVADWVTVSKKGTLHPCPPPMNVVRRILAGFPQ